MNKRQGRRAFEEEIKIIYGKLSVHNFTKAFSSCLWQKNDDEHAA